MPRTAAACRLLLLHLLFMLAGCATLAPAPAPAPPAPTPSLSGGPWLVREPATVFAALPPLPAVLPAAPPAPPDPQLLEAWRDPASRWMELELRAIRAEWTDPPHAARAIMLLAVAMHDALVVSSEARAAGMAVSDSTALSTAAARVLAYTHPLLSGMAATEEEAGTWAAYWRQESSLAGVAHGRLIGATVADAVIAWATADGSADATAVLELPAPAPGVWAPTAPDFAAPQEPAWSRVRTVAIGAPEQLRAPAPPAWGSPEMEAQLAAFVRAQAGLTAEQRAQAEHWAAGGGTVTPPGMWVERARELIIAHGLGYGEAAAIYAALGVALHDAAVACWETKYHYWFARPIQAMAERDPAWRPMIKTPPHPSYPSGHAAFSGAAAEVLAVAFPNAATDLRQEAQDAARSRVYGGIHWPIDGEAGLELGARVAARVVARATGNSE